MTTMTLPNHTLISNSNANATSYNGTVVATSSGEHEIDESDISDLFGPHGGGGLVASSGSTKQFENGQVDPLPRSLPVSLPPVHANNSVGFLLSPTPASSSSSSYVNNEMANFNRKNKIKSKLPTSTSSGSSSSYPSLYPDPGQAFDGSTVLEELVHQQSLHEHFERRLGELERQSVRVSSENALLKRVLMEYGSRQTETQQRLDKLIQLIYGALVSNNSLPPGLAESAVCVFNYNEDDLFVILLYSK